MDRQFFASLFLLLVAFALFACVCRCAIKPSRRLREKFSGDYALEKLEAIVKDGKRLNSESSNDADKYKNYIEGK